MMNIPDLPTDNLYKFISIVGLLIILIAISTLVLENKRIQSELIELDRNYSISIAKFEILINDSKELNSIINEYAKKNKIDLSDTLLNISDPSIIKNLYYILSTDVSQNIKNILELFNKVLSRQDSLSLNRINLKYDLIQISKKKTYLKHFTILTILTSCIGLILSIIGFKNWYYKYQKPQDELIRENSTSKKIIDSRKKIT